MYSLCYMQIFNTFRAKLSYLYFHPLEVVSLYCDPQLEMGTSIILILHV